MQCYTRMFYTGYYEFQYDGYVILYPTQLIEFKKWYFHPTHLLLSKYDAQMIFVRFISLIVLLENVVYALDK